MARGELAGEHPQLAPELPQQKGSLLPSTSWPCVFPPRPPSPKPGKSVQPQPETTASMSPTDCQERTAEGLRLPGVWEVGTHAEKGMR